MILEVDNNLKDTRIMTDRPKAEWYFIDFKGKVYGPFSEPYIKNPTDYPSKSLRLKKTKDGATHLYMFSERFGTLEPNRPPEAVPTGRSEEGEG